jgi:HPt (histidine-containing phosphotransfer) domain-containing protein
MDKEKIVVEVDEDLEELVPEYMEERQKDIKSINAALEQSDFETIRIAGHGMKGSGSGYGFNRITEIGKTLEEAAKVSDSEKIRQQLVELAEYLELVEVKYVETE